MKLPKSLRSLLRGKPSQRSPLERETQCCKAVDGERCPNAATWTPRIWFHPVGERAVVGREASAETGMAVCDDHKSDADIKLVFHPDHNPDGARQVRLVFHAQGKAEPDLEDVRVEWLPL